MAAEASPGQLTDFLRSLRAVRDFQRKPVSDDVVQDILEVARWSGSASNRQFVEIIVIRKRETLQGACWSRRIRRPPARRRARHAARGARGLGARRWILDRMVLTRGTETG